MEALAMAATRDAPGIRRLCSDPEVHRVSVPGCQVRLVDPESGVPLHKTWSFATNCGALKWAVVERKRDRKHSQQTCVGCPGGKKRSDAVGRSPFELVEDLAEGSRTQIAVDEVKGVDQLLAAGTAGEEYRWQLKLFAVRPESLAYQCHQLQLQIEMPKCVMRISVVDLDLMGARLEQLFSRTRWRVQSFPEGLASGPSDITNAAGKCHVTTTMATLASYDGPQARGSGHMSIRTEAVVGDEAFRMMRSFDTVYKKLMKGAVVSAPDGGETAVLTFRRPAWSDYEALKSLERAASDDWRIADGRPRRSHVPDSESYHLGIQTVCDTVNAELNDHALFRARLLCLPVNDFRSFREQYDRHRGPRRRPRRAGGAGHRSGAAPPPPGAARARARAARPDGGPAGAVSIKGRAGGHGLSQKGPLDSAACCSGGTALPADADPGTHGAFAAGSALTTQGGRKRANRGAPGPAASGARFLHGGGCSTVLTPPTVAAGAHGRRAVARCRALQCRLRRRSEADAVGSTASAATSLRAEAPEFVPAPKEEPPVPVPLVPGSPCGNFQPVMCVQGVPGSVPQMMQCQAIPMIAIPMSNMQVGTSAWAMGIMMPHAPNSATTVVEVEGPEAEAPAEADVSLDTPTVSDVEEDRYWMHCPKVARPKADLEEEQFLKPEGADGVVSQLSSGSVI
ncbi:unnamed protein product [Prorocentrum cordatum]|uniref:Uncharacterized protein n=1 Tax=Prorocentrum cordatum TaxID=2364126 RepID=A0ABN9VG99_9DINO|nr:unnamed protein product [Polarella glacialis]